MRLLPAIFAVILMFGCSRKTEPTGPAKHYHVSGTVVSVNPKDQSASIDAAAIPNYMEAMKMDYPVANSSDLEKLHPGDHIEATLDVYESGDYSISSLEDTSKASPK